MTCNLSLINLKNRISHKTYVTRKKIRKQNLIFGSQIARKRRIPFLHYWAGECLAVSCKKKIVWKKHVVTEDPI